MTKADAKMRITEPARAEATKDVSPEACETMGHVRAGIDRLDRDLVAIIAERQRYIEAAARIKPAKSEVRLEWRIEDVVAKVLAEAHKKGLSKRIAEPVWREMIEKCIEHEHFCWDLAHPGEIKKD